MRKLAIVLAALTGCLIVMMGHLIVVTTMSYLMVSNQSPATAEETRVDRQVETKNTPPPPPPPQVEIVTARWRGDILGGPEVRVKNISPQQLHNLEVTLHEWTKDNVQIEKKRSGYILQVLMPGEVGEMTASYLTHPQAAYITLGVKRMNQDVAMPFKAKPNLRIEIPKAKR